jgi:polygalacturonase
MRANSSTRFAFNVADYDAVGDGQTLDTRAIQVAIDACARAGGGTVFVPAGKYVTGSISLRDDITLYLDAGATLLGSENPADYPIIAARWEGAEQKTYAPLITGDGSRNIAVAGRGTIDGRGALWWKMHREKTLDYPRPRLISFTNCANIVIEGITATNSPSWTINPVRCENVMVDKVTIINPPDTPNTDGINPDSCRNVHISNCHVDVGDDCVTIKSGTEVAGRENLSPCENITITNCTMVHGHGGVVIGSEMSGSVRNVVISNCVFMGTDRGIRLKARRGRGGVVEDIRVTNIVMQDVLCPFTMNLYYHIGMKGNKDIADKRPQPVTEGTPRFRRIHFSHITVRNAQYAAGFLYGLPEMPVEDISFSDISISMSPNAQAGAPDMADDIEPMQRTGFFVRNARGLRLHNVEVANQFGPALMIADAADVDISASGTRTPVVDAPVILMQNVDGAFVHGCRASLGTGIFLQVEGKNTKEIALRSNHLVHAKRSVALAENVLADQVTGEHRNAR